MRLDSGDSTPTLIGLLRSLTAPVAAPLTSRFSRRRVRQWCRRQGYQLLRWREAKLFEGPSTWTADDERYRIQVLDGDGRQRGGYLVWRRWWTATQRAEVLWDEPVSAGADAVAPTRARILK
jgi:hypothetical protein